jgi:hypothetical protein
VETFSAPRNLVKNSSFAAQKKACLVGLCGVTLDEPLTDLVAEINQLSCCFTLQSCFGHFLYPGQDDPYCCDPLPPLAPGTKVKYKIAYLAFCLEDSEPGRRLLEKMKDIARMDPDHIQLGSPDWFWERQINAYALQVEPSRYQHLDTAVLDCEEAWRVEKTRNEVFREMEVLLRTWNG